MDEQFVNVFIQKQKALIDDLQQKLVVSETRAFVLESKVTSCMNCKLGMTMIQQT